MKFYFAALLVACAVACKKPTGSVSANLDNAALSESDWTISGSLGHITLHFDGSQVKFEINMEGQACGLAPYAIKGNAVEIGAMAKCPGVEGYVSSYEEKPQSCKYAVIEKSPEYRVVLNCRDYSFGRNNSRPAAGEVVAVGNQEYISMGNSVTAITDTVVFRSEPSAKAKEIQVDHGNVIEGPGAKSTTLMKGETIILLARTKEKHKVQSWENYWYYVVFHGTQPNYGWVFGEFIKQGD